MLLKMISQADSRPEYGTALTDAEGRFSLPTEGGSAMTVVYRKSGLISAQRRVYVPWNDIAAAETVHMIPEDPVATQAQISYPDGLTTDASGNLYITIYGTCRIRKVNTHGIITTIAGTGVCGTEGEGKPATEAQVGYPTDIAVDPSGSLYIADRWYGRILKADLPSCSPAYLNQGEILFSEENGTGHVISASGLHTKTVDLDTGVTVREFGYDADGRLITVTDPRFGTETAVRRDSSGVPYEIASPDSIITGLTIDAHNQLKRITYPDQSYYEFEYVNNDGLLTAKTEPEGNRFEHDFDGSGRVYETRDEEGGRWTFSRTREPDGNVLHKTITGENNLTTYLDYTDSAGRYSSLITAPSGAQTLFSRSADGLTVTKSLPCGTDLEFSYGVDPEYKFRYTREVRETTPAGLTKVTIMNKTYDDTDSDKTPDLITKTVTVNGRLTTFVHDITQATKTVTSPENRAVIMDYNPATLLTGKVSVPGLFETTYGYDIKGRLKSVKTGTRETIFEYDSKGNIDHITDPENHTTCYDYDELGRVKVISRPDTTDLHFNYDLNGNMELLTVPKPESKTADHGFGYNNVNIRDTYQTPMGKTYSYVYDRDRRLIRKTFPSAKEINYVYEPGKDRLEYISTPEGDINLTYHPCGKKVKTITKGTETISYEYDASLVTEETLGGTLNLSLGYQYNDDFAPESLTYAGSTVSYTYDNDGLLTGAGNFTITRKPENGLPYNVTGGNLNLTRTFSGYGETESENYAVSSQGAFSWSATRDDSGRIRTKTETAEGVTRTYHYDYDSMGRLLTVKDENSVLLEEYRYDPNGTRNYEMNTHRGIAGRNLTYSDEDYLLTAGSASYDYNPDGFLERKSDASGDTLYSYSSRGELLSVSLPDGRTIEYVHDPLGRRIAKKINNTVVEKYLWQDRTRLLAVYDGNDTLIMRFEYADGRMPAAMTTYDGSIYYLTCDQVGSLRIVTDVSGTVVRRIRYDSFGNIISPPGSNPLPEIPFGFAGGLHDRDTGLVQFGYRDYDPDTGRWTAKDPILFAGMDTDLYGYCLNDPVNMTDSRGLFCRITHGDPYAGGDPLYELEEIRTEGRQRAMLLYWTAVMAKRTFVKAQVPIPLSAFEYKVHHTQFEVFLEYIDYYEECYDDCTGEQLSKEYIGRGETGKTRKIVTKEWTETLNLADELNF